MFGSNLSSIAERKAREGSSKGKTKTDVEAPDIPAASGAATVQARPPLPKEQLLYDESNPPPKGVLMTCLEDVTSKMSDMEIARQRAAMWASKSERERKALHLVCMEYQLEELEYTHRIEREFGARYLGMIPNNFPEDEELNRRAGQFILGAMTLYVNALKARKEARGSKALIAGGKMPVNTMLEFLEGCNALMAMPETKATLRQVFVSTKKPPNERMIEMQRSVLVMLGYDADFGISCLNAVQRDYPDNREIAQKMQQFAICAQVHCQIACMSEEERERFYKDIPLFMYHCPHLYVMQQQMKMMQQRQMQMQTEAGRGQTYDHSHQGTSMSAEMASRVQEIAQNPEAKRMMEQLSTKMSDLQPRVFEKVSKWSEEQKMSYFSSFSGDPLLVDLQAAGDDPILRLEKFMSLNDEEIEKVITIQMIMHPSFVSATSKSSASSGSGGILGNVVGTLGSIFSTRSSSSQAVGTTMDHGHVHGPGCSHSAASSRMDAPDVTTGRADAMDR